MNHESLSQNAPEIPGLPAATSNWQPVRFLPSKSCMDAYVRTADIDLDLFGGSVVRAFEAHTSGELPICDISQSDLYEVQYSYN